MSDQMKKDYFTIAEHYRSCFEKFGDSHKGVDWPNLEDAEKRYSVMMSVIPDDLQVRVLDFGCGLGHLLEHIENQSFSNVNYTGLDINQESIDACLKKFPEHKFLCGDILGDGLEELEETYDVIIINGVFTVKRDLSFEDMWSFVKSCISILWEYTNNRMIFNVMSSHVDWEREDLFHLPIDLLADFLCEKISRDFVIRNDYQLYEYATIIYK